MTMIDPVLTLPDQLRWGLDLDAPALPTHGPMVLLGMGGSAMAASVASLGARSDAPIEIHPSYGLPGWAVASGAAVVAVSYSGNTEEVLSGVDVAIGAGLDLAAVSSGGRIAELAEQRGFPLVTVPAGMQPRAGVGYQAAGVAAILAASGRFDDAADQLAEAADVIEGQLDGGEGPAARRGEEIAAVLTGKATVIYGGFGVGATAAYRWKTQLNENGKVPAYAGVVSEMNHNEIEGWHESTGGPFAGVWLHDGADHPRNARRLELSAAVIGDALENAGTVVSHGTGALARFFSLAIVGDVASLAVAERSGIDPEPVETIERFKRQL
jgi:glucose/mannose-6-phosphate isomerase